jgi:hypothetical protein
MPRRWYSDANEYAGWTYGYAYADAAWADWYTYPLSHAHTFSNTTWAN